MQKRMGEAVARVARKVNDTVENKTDSLDLANCKLMTFPIGIYKAMRSVTEGIHNISLANNELKSLTSRFVTTFSQLRELNLAGNYLHRLPEEVTSLLHLRAINLSRNRFRHFPEPLAAVATLETIDLEENEIAAAEEPVSGFPSASLEEAGRSWYPPKDAEVPVEKLATMASLRSLNLRANPVGPEVRLLVRPLIPFDLLLSPEEPVPKA
ncbi:PREDICTED: leucine-rich repeat-containing protein 20 isoform X1 [Aptenodytes forsteri]|uniref:leucine-rich repeat-containing protein 20 isoform X1 n=1 Tax=Aptenodytes forsteri TaxID=9233 RepID=UPI0004F3FCDD|nr:PREDICTED: leucine-rich repeat-containing protein 20 isoform X1 [Aptenodytes forsteri]